MADAFDVVQVVELDSDEEYVVEAAGGEAVFTGSQARQLAEAYAAWLSTPDHEEALKPTDLVVKVDGRSRWGGSVTLGGQLVGNVTAVRFDLQSGDPYPKVTIETLGTDLVLLDDLANYATTTSCPACGHANLTRTT